MITQKEFSLTGSEGKIIYGDITFNEANKTGPLIIFVHGFKGFKDWGTHNLVARYFAQNGYRYLKFNLSHGGVTVENPNDVTDLNAFASNTFSKELTDIDLVINYAMQTQGITDVLLIGHSRGGGMAIITAVNNPSVKGLITWSSMGAFSDHWKKDQEATWKKEGKIEVVNARTKEQMPLNMTLLNDFEENKAQLDIVANAKQINIPWLVVHGTDDVNVPFEKAEKLANANPASRLLKIEGANHVYGASHPYDGESLPPQLFQAVEKSLKFLDDLA